MGKIYDGPAEFKLEISRITNINLQKPWLILVRFPPVASTDVRVRGFLNVYRNITGTEFADYFAYNSIRLTADRTAHIIPWQSNTFDIVALVPLYDFPRVEIWAEGAGLT